MNMTRITGMVVAALAVMVIAMPASAQVDLSGDWIALQHEDWQERGPGPEVVDYLGMPINDEARARALSYSTTGALAARAPVPVLRPALRRHRAIRAEDLVRHRSGHR